ncbi:MAG: HDOD domain-containing protein, partial [Silvanigrellaceae bacterium]|nr:HDOD domain-containing protein [Silvanigrellaceae bacterium]
MQSSFNTDSFEIPAVPQAVMDCLEFVFNFDYDIKELSKIIRQDVALTSAVLKLGNSQAYSMGQSTSDLSLSLSRIGSESLIYICLNHSILASFKFDKIKFFDLKNVLEHSVLVSKIANKIAKENNMADANDLIIAGIMHDIGLIAYATYWPENMAKIIEDCLKYKYDFSAGEKKYKLVPHDVIGKMILDHWNFPLEIGYIVQYHHFPESDLPDNLSMEMYNSIYILKLADTLAHRFGNYPKEYHRDTYISKA